MSDYHEKRIAELEKQGQFLSRVMLVVVIATSLIVAFLIGYVRGRMGLP